MTFVLNINSAYVWIAPLDMKLPYKGWLYHYTSHSAVLYNETNPILDQLLCKICFYSMHASYDCALQPTCMTRVLYIALCGDRHVRVFTLLLHMY